jgi:hypothetical protein
MVIAAMRGTGVVPPIVAEARLENGHQVERELARAIDLATREIAVVEIELAVATWEVVREIGVPSEMVADSAAAMRVQAAVEELPAWVVRVEGALAELAAEEAGDVAVAGGSEVVVSPQSSLPT